MSERQTLILEAAVRVIAQSGVRGLRIEKLAAEAGVSTALIYYHFQDRAGVLRRALEHINERAERYTTEALASTNPRTQLEQTLLLEIQNTPSVRENSIAWGELRATAIFDEDLRDQLRDATRAWAKDVETLIVEAQAVELADPDADPADASERLTALIEGLSERWLSGSITLERAQQLAAGAITAELGPRP
ncbi:TetR family transcriptional regulator [Rhodococcus sp. ACS1]|uniref:TetR/AcrR family transcriptional regulator n=1 Tax=Rhodococcus TaxID=1827 RepID=UPI000BB126EE|nr:MULTISPECIES: TetR/AcrR family transcriptional regulator [Rhodococcus]PBC39742.1 TetR family transcriptional regulator [Rhodococcus sp. ACS1]QSE78035.1 TetR/AcrR family transcriptional regulator [Rhodococcus koreensis]